MIDIKMYGRPKEEGQVTTSSQVILQSSNSNNSQFKPVYLWGQYFDDSKDINGDMHIEGTIQSSYINTKEIKSETAYFSYMKSDIVSSYIGEIQNLKGSNMEFDFASILKAFIGEFSSKSITTENLTVTKSAHFFELIIDQIKASGGAVIFTPANGFVVRKVEKLTNAYRLYFLANLRGEKITNMWKINDQAICQNFNRASSGDNYNVSNKYYWALVTNTNNEDLNGEAITINVGTTENIDMQPCHYIDISLSEYDGVLNPEVDDEVAMLGYRGNDDTARQNAIYISSYSSLDTDLKAPIICQYKGIKDFNLSSHKYTWFSGGVTPQGELNGVKANEIRGDFKVSDGRTLEDYINNQTQFATYRLVPSQTSINKDKDDILTPSVITLSCLKNEKGEVTVMTSCPIGYSCKVYTLLNSVYEDYLTIQEGQALSISLNDNIPSKDFIEIRLVRNEDSKVIDEVKVPVTFIDNSNTIVDRLIDLGTTSLLEYDGETNKYKLQYALLFSIYHYDGTEFVSVLDNTIPKATQYEVESFLVTSSGREWYKVTSQCSTILSDGQYKKTSDTYEWDNDAYNYVYLKVNLKTNGVVCDTLCVPITLSSRATLEVIQGETARILATVTGSEENWNSSYAYLSNFISQVSITAKENSSKIEEHTSYIDNLTGQMGEKVSWSYIIQHADEIELSVTEDLKKTGIDIKSGQITLNGDNTTIVGNLNITDTDNGITIFEKDKLGDNQEYLVPRINLQPKNISDISNLEEGHFYQAAGLFSPSADGASESSGHYTKTFTANTNVELEKFGVIDLTDFYVRCYRYSGSNKSTVLSPTMYIKVKYNNIIYDIDSVIMSNTGTYEYRNKEKKVRFTAPEAGQYTLIIEVTSMTSYSASYPDFSVLIGLHTYTSKQLETYIGRDGMYSQSGSMNLFYTSKDEIRLQHGFNGIRWKRGVDDLVTANRSMEVLASIYTDYHDTNKSLSLWLPFYNFTPTTILGNTSWTKKTIYLPSQETKYVYTIDPTTLNGIIVVQSLPFVGDYSIEEIDEAWIQLPNTQGKDSNNNSWALPTGYTVTIINCTNRNVYVTPYRWDSTWDEYTIIDANRNKNHYVGMNDNMTTRDTFIFVGGIPNPTWISMHDH